MWSPWTNSSASFPLWSSQEAQAMPSETLSLFLKLPKEPLLLEPLWFSRCLRSVVAGLLLLLALLTSLGENPHRLVGATSRSGPTPLHNSPPLVLVPVRHSRLLSKRHRPINE